MALIIDEKNNIFLTRGDNASLSVSLVDEQGDPYDASNDRLYFGVKRSALDASCILEKELEDSVLTLTHDDTAELPFGDYLYSIRLEHENEDEELEYYTPIAAARFSLGFDIVRTIPEAETSEEENGEG